MVLDQVGQLRHAVIRLSQPIQCLLQAALGIDSQRRFGMLLDELTEAGDRVLVAPRVVVALRQPQLAQRRRFAATEVVQQPAIAAARIVESFGLEVQIARARPGLFGQFAGRVQRHDRFPAVGRVAGAVQAQVAQPRLVQHELPLVMLRVAPQEFLVDRQRLGVPSLVEPHVGDVQQRLVEQLAVAATGVAVQHLLAGRHGALLVAFLRVGPGQQLAGRRQRGALGELAAQSFQTDAGLAIESLAGLRVGVDQQCPGAPRRAAGRQSVQQRVRAHRSGGPDRRCAATPPAACRARRRPARGAPDR